MESKRSLYEILVPTTMGDEAKPIHTRYHRVWDAKVRKITGGLTIFPPAKGNWLSIEEELFVERMIPVRIACTSEQMSTIADMTAAYYKQKAIMYYKVTDEVIIKLYE